MYIYMYIKAAISIYQTFFIKPAISMYIYVYLTCYLYLLHSFVEYSILIGQLWHSTVCYF